MNEKLLNTRFELWKLVGNLSSGKFTTFLFFHSTWCNVVEMKFSRWKFYRKTIFENLSCSIFIYHFLMFDIICFWTAKLSSSLKYFLMFLYFFTGGSECWAKRKIRNFQWKILLNNYNLMLQKKSELMWINITKLIKYFANHSIYCGNFNEKFVRWRAKPNFTIFEWHQILKQYAHSSIRFSLLFFSCV